MFVFHYFSHAVVDQELPARLVKVRAALKSVPLKENTSAVETTENALILRSALADMPTVPLRLPNPTRLSVTWELKSAGAVRVLALSVKSTILRNASSLLEEAPKPKRCVRLLVNHLVNLIPAEEPRRLTKWLQFLGSSSDLARLATTSRAIVMFSSAADPSMPKDRSLD